MAGNHRRIVAPGERPRFGSVWTWSRDLDYIRLMALAPGRVKQDADRDVVFLDLATGTVTKQWGWVTETSDPDSTWYCIDEGSPKAQRV